MSAVVVSLQSWPAADSLRSGHLAAGILAEADLVVVPDPPEALIAGETPFEVLIASLDGTGNIERLNPAHVDVLTTDTDGNYSVAFVRLAHPSSHTQSLLPAFDGRGLRQAFDNATAPSAWAAAGALGVTYGEPGSSEWTLAALPEVETQLRRQLTPPTDEQVTGDPEMFFFEWCDLLRCCIWPPRPDPADEQ